MDEKTQCWRRPLASGEELVAIIGVDYSTMAPAWRIMSVVDRGGARVRSLTDDEVRDMLESFGMLDAHEQDSMTFPTSRGFFTFINEARA